MDLHPGEAKHYGVLEGDIEQERYNFMIESIDLEHGGESTMCDGTVPNGTYISCLNLKWFGAQFEDFEKGLVNEISRGSRVNCFW